MTHDPLKCNFKFPAPIKDRATLEQAIIDHLASASLGAYPLKQIVLRFSFKAKRAGLKLQDVLQDMCDEGKIGIKLFQRLGRTFVFDGPFWIDCMKDYVGDDPGIFDRLEETTFKDMK